jgi:hypothetical protein
MPEILDTGLASGENGDVLQHGLAAVAKARRLHGRDLQPAAQLVHHEVASASPSMSSAMIKSGLPACTTASKIGKSACKEESFFSWMRMYGIVELRQPITSPRSVKT